LASLLFLQYKSWLCSILPDYSKINFYFTTPEIIPWECKQCAESGYEGDDTERNEDLALEHFPEVVLKNQQNS
jgi:hypothetical protein